MGCVERAFGALVNLNQHKEAVMRKELRCEHIDKSTWGDGYWRAEPDMVQWTDPQSSLLCLATRHRLGFLNGYVGVPENHPAYKLPCEAVMAAVHGGLSFAGHCKGIDEECARLWFFGFTCGSYLCAFGTSDTVGESQAPQFQ
jgi:hypothetical protein